MKPTFVLQVFNPELYKAQNNEPMPILLTRSEYWELAEVDGLDPSFCGLDAETTSDKVGNQNITTTYDGRNVSFTVSLFTPHIDDSLEFFSRYLVTGVYAILRIVEKPGLYLKCKIANYEFNRWTNGAEVTINLQTLDRFWHFDNTEAEEGNGFYVVSDVETKPYITDTTIISPGVDGYTLNKIILDVSHEKLLPSNYGADITIKTDTQRIVFAGIGYSVIAESKIHLEIDSAMPAAYFYLGTSKIDMTAKVDLDDNNQEGYEVWDWTLKPGFSKISAKYLFYNTTTGEGLIMQAGLFDVQTRPKFATYPKGLTSSETFTLSPYLVPENIAVGVTILGVTGTYAGGAEVYTGKTEITPSYYDQYLQTVDKYVKDNIVVKAIPLLQESDIHFPVSKGGTIKHVLITDRDQEIHVGVKAEQAGWYYGYAKTEDGKLSINSYIETALDAGDLKEGTTFLEREGEAYKSIVLQDSIPATTTANGIMKLFRIINIEDKIKCGAPAFLFAGCTANIIQIPGLDSEGATSLKNMFSGCTNITDLDLTMLNTSLVTNLTGMFYACSNLVSLDISTWDTSKATSLEDMFSGCTNITDLDLTILNTSLVTNLTGMFYTCSNLVSLDISTWDTSKVTWTKSMFYPTRNMFAGCTSLTTVTWPENCFPIIKEGLFSAPALDLTDCPLSHDSCLDLFNKLATRTDTATIKLSAITKALMSDEEIAIATGKGWTITAETATT